MKKKYIGIECKNDIKQKAIKSQKKYKSRTRLIAASGFMLPILCSGPTILFKYIKEGDLSDIFQTAEYMGFMSIYVGSISYFISKSVLKDYNKIKELENIFIDINELENSHDFNIITYKDMDYIKDNRKYEQYKVLFKQKKD